MFNAVRNFGSSLFNGKIDICDYIVACELSFKKPICVIDFKLLASELAKRSFKSRQDVILLIYYIYYIPLLYVPMKSRIEDNLIFSCNTPNISKTIYLITIFF